ncbi:hypothetical protein PHMEG_00012373 [Phytophthora megakarya]|uniref:RNase H type-1 domain-containing protein n=1 Tax=Phytophthora megakarya TaxID=4795 RepID=A0A225W8X0_9STRA|nr:hypothetical protein PHMEG_00012373 [Phytophthora megakarya]
MASGSLSSRRTTNNIAEYRGLKDGLSRAAEIQLRYIHVVGDSALIIYQMRHRKSPKAPHPRSIYSQCQGIVDRVHVRPWTHHIRAFNKAADQLANVAMYERVSRQIFKSDQVDHIPPWANVLRIASGDMEHWRGVYLETGSGMSDVEAETG